VNLEQENITIMNDFFSLTAKNIATKLMGNQLLVRQKEHEK
jgi:3-methyladenine DNA glycosylase Mpg